MGSVELQMTHAAHDQSLVGALAGERARPGHHPPDRLVAHGAQPRIPCVELRLERIEVGAPSLQD